MKARIIDSGINEEKSIRIKKIDQFFLNSPFHFHNTCEIVLVEQSFGKRIVGDNIEDFLEGDLVFMAPNLPHIWQNDAIFFLKKKEYRVKATVVYFSPSLLLQLAENKESKKRIQLFLEEASRGLLYNGDTRKKVQKLLIAISNKETFEMASVFFEVLHLLFNSTEYNCLASKGFKHSYTSKDVGRLNDVYQFIFNNFKRNITLREVASGANMSITAFCRYFKNHTQKSLIHFINEIRIEHACKLLRDTNYSISGVCYESGYNNTVHFNKWFKSITHRTPSEYRRDLIDNIPKVKFQN